MPNFSTEDLVREYQKRKKELESVGNLESGLRSTWGGWLDAAAGVSRVFGGDDPQKQGRPSGLWRKLSEAAAEARLKAEAGAVNDPSLSGKLKRGATQIAADVVTALPFVVASGGAGSVAAGGRLAPAALRVMGKDAAIRFGEEAATRLGGRALGEAAFFGLKDAASAYGRGESAGKAAMEGARGAVLGASIGRQAGKGFVRGMAEPAAVGLIAYQDPITAASSALFGGLSGRAGAKGVGRKKGAPPQAPQAEAAAAEKLATAEASTAPPPVPERSSPPQAAKPVVVNVTPATGAAPPAEAAAPSAKPGVAAKKKPAPPPPAETPTAAKQEAPTIETPAAVAATAPAPVEPVAAPEVAAAAKKAGRKKSAPPAPPEVAADQPSKTGETPVKVADFEQPVATGTDAADDSARAVATGSEVLDKAVQSYLRLLTDIDNAKKSGRVEPQLIERMLQEADRRRASIEWVANRDGLPVPDLPKPGDAIRPRAANTAAPAPEAEIAAPPATPAPAPAVAAAPVAEPAAGVKPKRAARKAPPELPAEAAPMPPAPPAAPAASPQAAPAEAVPPPKGPTVAPPAAKTTRKKAAPPAPIPEPPPPVADQPGSPMMRVFDEIWSQAPNKQRLLKEHEETIASLRSAIRRGKLELASEKNPQLRAEIEQELAKREELVKAYAAEIQRRKAELKAAGQPTEAPPSQPQAEAKLEGAASAPDDLNPGAVYETEVGKIRVVGRDGDNIIRYNDGTGTRSISVEAFKQLASKWNKIAPGEVPLSSGPLDMAAMKAGGLREVAGEQVVIRPVGKYARTFRLYDPLTGEQIGRVAASGEGGKLVWRAHVPVTQEGIVRIKAAGDAPSPGKTNDGITTKRIITGVRGRLKGQKYHIVETRHDNPEAAVLDVLTMSGYSRAAGTPKFPGLVRFTNATEIPLEPRRLPENLGTIPYSEAPRAGGSGPMLRPGEVPLEDPQAISAARQRGEMPPYQPKPSELPRLMGELERRYAAGEEEARRIRTAEREARERPGYTPSTYDDPGPKAIRKIAKGAGVDDTYLVQLSEWVHQNRPVAEAQFGKPEFRSEYIPGQGFVGRYGWGDADVTFPTPEDALTFRIMRTYAEQLGLRPPAPDAITGGTLPKADAPTSLAARLEARGRHHIESGRAAFRAASPAGGTLGGGLGNPWDAVKGLSQEAIGYAEVALSYMLEGGKVLRRRQWAARMLQRYGDDVRPHLDELYKRLKPVAEKIRGADPEYARERHFDPKAWPAVARSAALGEESGAYQRTKAKPKTFQDVKAGAAELEKLDNGEYWRKLVEKPTLTPEETHYIKEVWNRNSRAVQETLDKIEEYHKRAEAYAREAEAAKAETRAPRLAEPDPAELESLRAQLNRLSEDGAKLAGAFVNERTEAGRKLAYFRIVTDGAIERGDVPGFIASAKRIIGRDLTPDEQTAVADIIGHIQRARNRANRAPGEVVRYEEMTPHEREAYDRLRGYLASRDKVDFLSTLPNFMRANVLTAPATHIWNQVSNLGAAVMNEAVMPIAARVDDIVAKRFGLNPVSYYAKPSFEQFLTGLREGHKGFKRIMSGRSSAGLSRYDVAALRPTDFGSSELGKAAGKLYDAYVKSILRFTAASDQYGRGVARERTLAGILKKYNITDPATVEHLRRIAHDPAPRQFENALEAEVARAARDWADYSVYGNESIMHKLFSQARKTFSDHSKLLGTLLDSTVLFSRTLSSIAGRAASTSPLGLAVNTARYAAKLMKLEAARKRGLPSKELDKIFTPQQRAALNVMVAEGLVGTALWAAAYWMAKKGILRSAPGMDDAPTNEATGLGPLAMRIGDQWVEISRATPFSPILSSAAATARADTRHPDDVANPAYTAAISPLQQVVQLPLAQTIKNTLDALFEEGDSTRATSAAARVAGGMGVALIPAVSAQRTIARVADPVKREVKGATEWERFMNQIKNSIPGQKETLPPRVDALGNVVKDTDPMLGLLLRGPQTPVEEAVVQQDVQLRKPRPYKWEAPDEFAMRSTAEGLARRLAALKGLENADRLIQGEQRMREQMARRAADAGNTAFAEQTTQKPGTWFQDQMRSGIPELLPSEDELGLMTREQRIRLYQRLIERLSTYLADRGEPVQTVPVPAAAP